MSQELLGLTGRFAEVEMIGGLTPVALALGGAVEVGTVMGCEDTVPPDADVSVAGGALDVADDVGGTKTGVEDEDGPTTTGVDVEGSTTTGVEVVGGTITGVEVVGGTMVVVGVVGEASETVGAMLRVYKFSDPPITHLWGTRCKRIRTTCSPPTRTPATREEARRSLKAVEGTTTSEEA